jgi:flagellar protein FliS
MAYERVITACDRAEAAVVMKPARWVELFHDETVRAQQILLELTSGLALSSDDTAVRELARHMGDLYMFSIEQLVQANLSKTTQQLRAVRNIIDGLRDAWVTIG